MKKSVVITKASPLREKEAVAAAAAATHGLKRRACQLPVSVCHFTLYAMSQLLRKSRFLLCDSSVGRRRRRKRKSRWGRSNDEDGEERREREAQMQRQT